MNKERISKSSYEKAYILESPLKTGHLETSSFIKKEALPMMFYYELLKVLIDIDICVEQLWKSAYIGKIMEPVHA